MEKEGIQLNEFDSGLIKCLDKAPANIRNRAKQAINHLEKAWIIRSIDPETAYFKVITAEEEMATAIFYYLKNKHYLNANKIKMRSHQYKQAVFPFMVIISNFFEKIDKRALPKARLLIEDDVLWMEVKFPGISRWARPLPPLNVILRSNENLYNFKDEVDKYLKEQGKDTIQKHLIEIANIRNKLLYAGDEGIPKLEGDVDQLVNGYKNRIFFMLKVLCLIFPHKGCVNFVQQCLNSFLLAMGDIEWEL